MSHHAHIHTSQPVATSAIDRTVPDFPVALADDESHYFATNRAPEYLDELVAQTTEFVSEHKLKGRKVVLVTSGGTTVPLENNTVRFIDNFSAGTRGATSAEYFLEQGYAVIFLHHYMSEDSNGSLVIAEHYRDEMHELWKKHNAARDQNLLLLLPFTTVNQYLFSLKSIAQAMDTLGTKALFYLAAAVSDFFLPVSRMPEHKIQAQDHSDGGKLVVNLDPVPKFLRRLVDSWAPGAMITSFKLETDKDLLIKKATQALERYHHQLVIGNLLQTRKKEVVFVTPTDQHWFRLVEGGNHEIESLIVPAVIERHENYIKSHV